MACLCGAGQAAPIDEDFDNVAGLTAAGWTIVNNGTPGGDPLWFQGNPGVFAAQSGAPDSYLAANFLAAPFGGTIDLWMFTPLVDLSPWRPNTIEYSWRGNPSGLFTDTLALYFSPTGSLSDVTLLHAQFFFTDPGGWQTFTFDIGLQSSPGYYAFRYFVSDTSSAGDYIGIDSVRTAIVVPEPSSIALISLAVAGLAFTRRRRR